MLLRRTIIGAFGGDRQKKLGRELGASVVQSGRILLTGGSVNDTDEIKDAAMFGAHRSEGVQVVARLIGILPNGPRNWYQPCEHQLFLKTGLPHYIRNVINGMTPDVAIVFGGGRGTLAETAFAIAAEKKLYFRSGLERLKLNLRKYFTGPNADATDFETYFCRPLDAYPEASGRVTTAKELLSLLAETLLKASENSRGIDELVSQTPIHTQESNKTGFPGLPNDAESKERFERIVTQISM